MAMSKKLTNFLLLAVLVTVFVCANATGAEIIMDGLVAYWPLDSDTIDDDLVLDVAGENDGTITGDLKITGGQVGEALEFDGESYVDIPGTESLDFSGQDEMTVMAWVSVGTDDPVIGVVAGCCGTIVAQRDVNGWALRYDGRNPAQEMEFIVCPDWQGDGGFGAQLFEIGEWHHLTGIVAETELQFYLDGALLNTIPFAGPISTGGTETEIGWANDGGFIGLIDEVLIYNRALSEEEVQQSFLAEGLAVVDSSSKLATCWGKMKK
jgi:hypothetical protein